jgi:hypothetical protein
LYKKFILALILFGVASCQSVPLPGPGQSMRLASAAENKVEVTISLVHDLSGEFILSAAFTPQLPTLHLYSMEIPQNGVDGVGRPTMLELAENSQLTPNGKLSESITAIPRSTSANPDGLLLYPVGPVTLSLPILLPEGKGWVTEQVLVTYMACDDLGCRAPVEKKPITLHSPGKGLFEQ